MYKLYKICNKLNNVNPMFIEVYHKCIKFYNNKIMKCMKFYKMHEYEFIKCIKYVIIRM